MTQKIEIKNRWTGEVIFSHECEDNTYTQTIDAAIKRGVNLRGANLRGVNLRGVNLGGTDLRGVNLGYADLRGVNLGYADLGGADLRGTDLGGANLRGTNLRGTDLGGADLRGAIYDENTAFLALQCPEEGEFIAWKKIKSCIVRLLIPADAQRSSATSRKCRASKAHVLAIYDGDGNEIKSVVSDDYVTTTYTVGEDVLPDSWDDDRWNECSHGIHFFITRQEAELY